MLTLLHVVKNHLLSHSACSTINNNINLIISDSGQNGECPGGVTSSSSVLLPFITSSQSSLSLPPPPPSSRWNAHVCGSGVVPLKSETSARRHSHASEATRNATMVSGAAGGWGTGQKALIAHFLRSQGHLGSRSLLLPGIQWMDTERIFCPPPPPLCHLILFFTFTASLCPSPPRNDFDFIAI